MSGDTQAGVTGGAKAGRLARLCGLLLDGWPILYPLGLGLIVGFWPTQVLAGHFPTHLPPYRVAWLSTLFWAVFVGGMILTVIYLRRARRQTERADEEARRLRTHVTTLTEQVTTLTEQVLALKEQSLHDARAKRIADLAANAMARINLEYEGLRGQPEAAIRRILWWFAALAWIVDGEPDGVRYAANVMLFEPWATASPTVRKLVVFSDYDDGEIEGVLVLQPRLSTTRTSKAAPDDQIRAIALPVPTAAAATRDGRGRVLPGAPTAFFEKSEAEVYSDAQQMIGYCTKGDAFSQPVIAELRAYLASPAGQLVRSLISVRLMPADAHKPSGVLNIHRDSTGILDGSAIHFVDATVQLRGLLSHALALVPKRINDAANG